MPFSEFLNSRREDCHALVDELSKTYAYVGILGADVKSTAILAGRNADKIILKNCFEEECAKVMVATDDGSMGYHGFADALVRQELEQDSNYDYVLACGPKPMLRKVAEVAEKGSMQLQMFQLDDPVLVQIRDQIRGLDINSLTPLEALNKLNEIKKITGI